MFGPPDRTQVARQWHQTGGTHRRKKRVKVRAIGQFAELATPTFLTGQLFFLQLNFRFGRGRRSGAVRACLHGTQKSSERCAVSAVHFPVVQVLFGRRRRNFFQHRSLRSREATPTFYLATQFDPQKGGLRDCLSWQAGCGWGLGVPGREVRFAHSGDPASSRGTTLGRQSEHPRRGVPGGGGGGGDLHVRSGCG